MRRILLALVLLVGPLLRAEDPPPPPTDVPPPPLIDCPNTAEIQLEDSPRSRLGDPRRAEKDSAGINPLQIKFVGVTATVTDLVFLIRTHDSVSKYLDYAARRDAAGAPIRPRDSFLRGLNFQFIAYRKERVSAALRGAVWLDYTPGNPTPQPRTVVEKDPGYSAGYGWPVPNPGGGLAANVGIAADALINMNEVEVRLPLASLGFASGEALEIKTRQGDVTVCVP